MHELVVSTWAEINEGCPVRCTVSGSNLAHIVFGGESKSFELGFDVVALRRLAQVTTAAVADMDARYETEEATRAAADHSAGNTADNAADNTAGKAAANAAGNTGISAGPNAGAKTGA